MKITTEVINSNKDKIKIHVEPNCNYSSRNIEYRISLEITPYRKRKSFFLNNIISDDYSFRVLYTTGRPVGTIIMPAFLYYKEEAVDSRSILKAAEKTFKEEVLKYITIEQLQIAVNNAYDALKPTAENIKF